MSGAIRIDLSEVRALNERLDAFANLDMRPLMDAVGFEVENQTKQRLSEHGPAPSGEPWAPWSPRYARRRPKKGGLLELTGALRDSITHAVSGEHHVDVGSNLVYAAIQQFGGQPGMAPGPAAIPARPYLGLSEENEADVHNVVNDWLDEQLRRLA